MEPGSSCPGPVPRAAAVTGCWLTEGRDSPVFSEKPPGPAVAPTVLRSISLLEEQGRSASARRLALG